MRDHEPTDLDPLALDVASNPWPDLHDDLDLTESWDMGPPSDPPDLTGKDEAASVELMVEWFCDNFEDPAHETPYDEGAYVYIWGGPYYAHEELENAFGSLASEKLIEAAVAKIEAEGWEWAPAGSRMRPDAPENDLIAAKRKLAVVLDNTKADAATAEFNPQAVALVLHELHCLQQRLDSTRSNVD